MPPKVTLFMINLIGGVSVLGGYVHGLQTHVATRHLLWGEIPVQYQGIYTLHMAPATIGYLITFYFLMKTPDLHFTNRRPALPVFSVLYFIFLLSASLWMPLSFQALDSNDPGLFPAIQAVLAITGIAALAIIVALTRLKKPASTSLYKAALAGSCFLFIQCGILDALIWPRFFTIQAGG